MNYRKCCEKFLKYNENTVNTPNKKNKILNLYLTTTFKSSLYVLLSNTFCFVSKKIVFKIKNRVIGSYNNVFEPVDDGVSQTLRNFATVTRVQDTRFVYH